MIWNESTPYRTGVPTARRLVETACVILTKFSPIIKAHLAPERHIYVDDLMAACNAFIANVPSPRPD